MKKLSTEAERLAMEEEAVAIIRGIYPRRLTGKIVINAGQGVIHSVQADGVVIAANGVCVVDLVPGIGNDRVGRDETD